MESSYFIATFATFGSPNGFQQRFWLAKDEHTAEAIPTFDLDPNAIQLYPGCRVYALRKIAANGRSILAYSLYTHADEPHSHREGTFIGSSILFVGQVAEESITLALLDAIHGRLEKMHVRDGVLSIQDGSQFKVAKPKDFDKIGPNLRDVGDLDFSRNASNRLAIFGKTDRNALLPRLKIALNELLESYGTIYFTQSKEVAKYVQQKNMFPIVDNNGFETERKRLAEARKRSIQEALEWFDQEKTLLDNVRKGSNSNYKKQFDAAVHKHRENERRIKEYTDRQKELNGHHQDLSQKMDSAIAGIKNGKRPEDQKRLHEENKRIFVDSILRQEKPVFMDELPKLEVAIDMAAIEPISKHVRPKNNPPFWPQPQYPAQDSMTERISKTYEFRTSTWILLLLWVGTLAYFVFFGKTEKKNATPKPIPAQQEQTDSVKNKAIDSLNNRK